MKAVITCGGTGGHITPALAIADIIKENDPRGKILFVGGTHGMEGELVSRAGYDIHLLAVQGLARKLTPTNLKVLFQAGRAVKRAREILAAFSPDIVIGTGGYACYPTLRAAIGLGIPTAVHESNAVPGLAVRLLAGRLDRVWLNFGNGGSHLPSSARVRTVGNPLPRGYAVPRPIALPSGVQHFLLSFGGSLGASVLNRAVLELMEGERERTDIYHLHATGQRAYEGVYAEFCERKLQSCPQVSLVPFITQMPRYMSAADLYITKPGGLTTSEAIVKRLPMIFINAVPGCETRNFDFLISQGVAVGAKKWKQVALLMQKAFREEALFEHQVEAMKAFSTHNAAEQICRHIVGDLRKQ
jgi:UDP-N-acetylglucosamine--N-acetylmuramyl-(pentapeptide) pyrophosphoryl-undecaprenol N-acetylglucosamine transferase